MTNNVLELTSVPYAPHLMPPSSKHLARRRNALAGPIESDLLTIGGRVYMLNATIGNQPFTLVIDTGSADTWVASSSFQCNNPYTSNSVPEDCGFGALYDAQAFEKVEYQSKVAYSGGEFLNGDMRFEDFGLSTGEGKSVSVKQMIGVVDEGYWMGNGISSGLMGLGFPALARGVNSRDLNYTGVLYTM